MEKYKTCNRCQVSKPLSSFNKDKSRKDSFSYRCKQCHVELSKASFDNQQAALYANRYYRKNKDAINEKARAKRANNPTSHREYKRDYYARNKARINKLSNEWRKANPEPNRRAKNKRRFALKQLRHEPYTVQDVLNKYGTDCHLCNEPINLEAPRWTASSGWQEGLHIDHVVRVRDGGEDTLDNVRPAHGKCNLQKR